MSGDPEQECFFDGSLGEQGCRLLRAPPQQRRCTSLQFEGNVGRRQAFADIGADLARLIRTTRHVGYRISQSCRAMAECIFGWGKQHGTMRKTKHRGIAAVAADFMLNLIAYNLVRIPKLIAA